VKQKVKPGEILYGLNALYEEETLSCETMIATVSLEKAVKKS
jgi:hypothetical protein